MLNVHIHAHMRKQLERAYLGGLGLLLLRLADVAKQMGRPYRTLQSYRLGERRVTPDAGRELAAFLRARAVVLTTAAERIEAAIHSEED